MFSRKSTLRPYSIVPLTIVLLCSLCITMQAAPFECFAVSDLVRVFEDGYNIPADPGSVIEVFGIRNEYVSAQCAVKANQDLEHVTISVSPLVNPKRSASFARNAMRWNFVESILIRENTPKYRQTDLIRRAPAWFPDYLVDDRQISLKKGKYRGIFLTIHIPSDAEEGDYQGTVTIKTERGEASIPIHLTVYPLTLPDERHLMVTEWYTTSQFKKFHDIDPSDSKRFYEMLSQYAENMAEHRQNVFRVSLDLIVCKLDDKGKLQFDFTKFDKWTRVSMNNTVAVEAEKRSGKKTIIRQFDVLY